MQADVVIVGGGLAGLHAAHLLHDAGVALVLVEARDRLGGRIFSADVTASPSDDGFDLGPSWYWPQMQPAIGALVAKLGLRAFPQTSDGDVVFERMSRETPRRYRPYPLEHQSMRLVGGSGALVRALARDLPGDRIRLATRVTAMTLLADGVELALASADGGASRMLAQHVIAALPPRVIEATVAFTPALDPEMARQWRDTPTWMAPHAKFFAIYERPFWREAGLSGTAQSMVGPMPEIHDATTASGQAALFGFLGVAAARRAALGEVALARACLEQLARLFGPDARHPRATLFKDWAADPLTATDADRGDGGHPAPQASWVSGPWQARLALAGSETADEEPGYLAGAVVAGARAADATLARLTSTRTSA